MFPLALVIIPLPVHIGGFPIIVFKEFQKLLFVFEQKLNRFGGVHLLFDVSKFFDDP